MATAEAYQRAGEARAYALGNRGPIRFGVNGTLHPDITSAYARTGFYVFEGVLGNAELADLRTELADVLERAPIAPGSAVDRRGRPAFGRDCAIPLFTFGRPLSDPYGGTDKNHGRHPAKMAEPTPAADAPEQTIYFIYGILQALDSCLRLYGHPQLLRVAEAVNGADFAPFADSIWIKEPGLGTSVAWHQDGTTHWDHPRWHEDIHGFNFMAQLYPTTPANALWVVPGSHKRGKVDIKALVEAAGSDRLPDAVPMLGAAGDVAICNRQALHGSFANTSPDRRVSVVFGFHRRDAVLNVKKRQRDGTLVVYDDARIRERSRAIQAAIEARAVRYPQETPYIYQPFVSAEHENWNVVEKPGIDRVYDLKDYNVLNLGL